MATSINGDTNDLANSTSGSESDILSNLKKTDFSYAPVVASEGGTPSWLVDDNRVSLVQVAPHEDALLNMVMPMQQRGFNGLYSPQFLSSPNGTRTSVKHDLFENPTQWRQEELEGQPEDDALMKISEVSDVPFFQKSPSGSILSALSLAPFGTLPTMSTSTFKRPIREAAATTTRSNGLIESGENENALRALVVDDDDVTRRLMGNMLKRLGVMAELAENGKVAYEKMMLKVHNAADADGQANTDQNEGGEEFEEGSLSSSEPYDVVFLDNEMPVMSGPELVAKLRKRGRNDFIIGVTANALPSDQQEYLDYGADHVLTKPVYEPNIKSMLVQALERRRQKQFTENAQSYNPEPRR